MLKLAVLFIFFFSVSYVFSQEKDHIMLDSIIIENADEEGHSFSFTLIRDKFDAEKHDVSRISENIIDGKYIYGVDAGIPGYEIKKFTLSINDKEINIKPEIYNIFYNPGTIYKDGQRYVDAFWGSDYKSVYVLMNGSDAAGSYHVIWHLKENGDHSYMKPTYDEIYFMFR